MTSFVTVSPGRLRRAYAGVGDDLAEVLVAPPGEADDHQLGIEVERAGERVGALERRDDPLGSREPVQRGERLLVGAWQVHGPSRIAQRGMLGADARIVEPGGDRVRVCDLAVVV